MLCSELGDLLWLIDAEIFEPKATGEKSEISRRVIEDAGEKAGVPKKLQVGSQSEVARMQLHVIEHRNHRSENPEEEPAELLDRSEGEFVPLINRSRRPDVCDRRCGDHDQLAPTSRNADERDKNNEHQPDVAQTIEAPFFARGDFFPNEPRSVRKVESIDAVKNGEKAGKDN